MCRGGGGKIYYNILWKGQRPYLGPEASLGHKHEGSSMKKGETYDSIWTKSRTLCSSRRIPISTTASVELGVHNFFDPRPSRPASLTTRSAEIEDVFELPAGLLQIGPSAPTRGRNRAIGSNCGLNRSLLPYSKEYMDVCSLVLISFHDHLV